MSEVSAFQKSLLDEVRSEGEKFGEDIKHLADFTSGCKKFEPWIEKAEAKKAAGMRKPKNLQEAEDSLVDAQVISATGLPLRSREKSPKTFSCESRPDR